MCFVEENVRVGGTLTGFEMFMGAGGERQRCLGMGEGVGIALDDSW